MDRELREAGRRHTTGKMRAFAGAFFNMLASATVSGSAASATAFAIALLAIGCGPLMIDGGTSAPASDLTNAGGGSGQGNTTVPGASGDGDTGGADKGNAGTGGNSNGADGGGSAQDGNGGAPSPNDNVGGDLAGGTQPAAVRFLGRMDPAAPVLSWPGSGVLAAFTGTGGTATFRGISGATHLGLSVDEGAAQRVVLSPNGKVRVSALVSDRHTVRLVKLNEAELGVAEYVSFAPDGTLTAPASPNRRLEFIGGSMTLGYGIEGTDPCSNSAAMENVLRAYSGQTAQLLAAELTVVAWSGRGLTRNSIGNNGALFSQLYPRARADVDGAYSFPSATKPDAVIFNFGTNDFANQGNPSRALLDQQAFTQAYLNLIQQVRQHYPAAAIVLTTSPMLYNSTSERQHDSLLQILQNIRASLTDANVRVVDFPSQSSSKTGCNTHPNASTHASMAQQLAPVLREMLSW